MPGPKLAESTLTLQISTKAGIAETRDAGQLMLILTATPVDGLTGPIPGLPGPTQGMSPMQVDTFGFDGQKLNAQGHPTPLSPYAAVQMLVAAAVVLSGSISPEDARHRLLLDFADTYFEMLSEFEGVAVETARSLEGASDKGKVH